MDLRRIAAYHTLVGANSFLPLLFRVIVLLCMCVDTVSVRAKKRHLKQTRKRQRKPHNTKNAEALDF